ncbi:DNA processing protein [Hydrogenivirga caldilitoris]|uniref:DNA processing protein n=1 Tax=Hydrogenivirga caldilitoris TaxID=246264 RepID=A0A497XSM4_9AQUI|nr:DNA-processing protein DprA [Hydrogenivirga caldilitoris]RLJ71304.1 DNA processing protein [Hydrogenivirga caldilitoris]
MEKVDLWLRLKLTKGLGDRTLAKLYRFFGDAERIVSANFDELKSLIGEKKANALVKGEYDREIFSRLLDTIERHSLKVMTIEDDTYPEHFRTLQDPPALLFLKGNLRELPLFGIVGTRKPTPYTLSFIEDLVKLGLSKGYGIVSGGAPGVDSKSHESAIENGGYTVCVLGYGILKARGSVFKRIEDAGGALLTEFLPHEPGSRHTFPRRNRLIAALSEFLVIPEAGKGSGSMITAGYAFEQGKRVYVHIGIGRSPNWEGCYQLLREGKATLIKDGFDLFGHSGGEGKNDLIDFLKVPRSLEDIRDFLKLSEGETLALLTKMEIEGKVKRMGAFYLS